MMMTSPQILPDRRYINMLKSNLGVALALMCLVLLLHGSALSAGWRSDDGALLAAAALFSPWQYFFIPSVTSLVSASSHVTPWNVFVYDINLMLFGLAAPGHYAHALLSLWISAFMLYACAGLWMRRFWAAAAATLYVASPPAVEVAQQLMTGHYLEGLVFSLAAIMLHFHSHRQPASMRFAVLAAVFYGLSTTCKEVYVPLVCLLPWIAPADTRLRQRVMQVRLAAAVALAYVGWRYLVLGRLLGGYAEATPPTLDLAMTALETAASLLFGTSAYAVVATALALACITMGLGFRRSRMPVLLGLFSVLLPLVPLIAFPGIALRHLFVPWAALCVLTGFVASTVTSAWSPVAKNASIGAVVFLALVTLAQTITQTQRVRGASLAMEVQSNFILQHDGPGAIHILPHSRSGSPGYQDICLSGIAYAARLVAGHTGVPPNILSHPVQVQLAVNNGQRVYGFDVACSCMRSLSADEMQAHLRTMGGPFPMGSDRLAFHYQLDTVQNKLTLDIDPWLDGAYFIRLETLIGNSVVLPITRTGAAFPPNGDLHIYLSRFEVWHLDAQQRLVASPSLEFSGAADRSIKWGR